MIEIPITEELENICKEIVSKDLSLEQWSEIESDDMFQSNSFTGGFDADENEFCFSYFCPQNKEYWFQFDLSKANKIAIGAMAQLNGRKAE